MPDTSDLYARLLDALCIINTVGPNIQTLPKSIIGPIAICARDVLRQIVFEHELDIITGKVASDHVHMFISYRPTQDISKIMQWLKGISSRILLSEFPHLKKQFWGKHLRAQGYLAVSSGNITDEMIRQYIQEQEGEPVTDDNRRVIQFCEGIPYRPIIYRWGSTSSLKTLSSSSVGGGVSVIFGALRSSNPQLS